MLHLVSWVSSIYLLWYQFFHFRLAYSFIHHFFLFWFTTLLIRNSFIPGLKPTCFTNPTHRSFTAYMDYYPDRFFWATQFLFLFFLFFSFLCRALNSAAHFVSFWVLVKLPYRIVSYRIVWLPSLHLRHRHNNCKCNADVPGIDRELVIVRHSPVSGSVMGGDEVFILCEKIQRGEMQRFSSLRPHNQILVFISFIS